MKSPDEIKKGLKCCNNGNCKECPYRESEHVDCQEQMLKDALAYIEQLESREWELFDLLSSVWHGKQYYFKQDDGTVYSRQSCEYLTFDQAIDEFAYELTAQRDTAQSVSWTSPKDKPPDVTMFWAVTKYNAEPKMYRKNLVDPDYTTEWLNIRNEILWWMPVPEVPKEELP